MVYLQQGRTQDSQGQLTLLNQDGKVIFESFVRQCIHCQYTWTHKPGSGILRGFCKRCNGSLCGRDRCFTCYHKEKQIEDLEAIGWANKRAIEAAVRHLQLREDIYSYLSKKRHR